MTDYTNGRGRQRLLMPEHQWSPMSPETTIQKARKAPAATSVNHIVRASSRTRTQHRGTRTRTRSDLV
jgi:hypothetical protein